MSRVPGVEIGPLRWWQIDACARVDAEVFPQTSWSVETFWTELARVPESRYYLMAVETTDPATAAAGADPRVVGYAGLAALPPEADVQTIAVSPEAQGIGLGAALLDELLDEAERRDCTTVMLEVRADNERAIALYQRREFELLSSRRDYYGPGLDALIMRRRVGGAEGGSGHG